MLRQLSIAKGRTLFLYYQLLIHHEIHYTIQEGRMQYVI